MGVILIDKRINGNYRVVSFYGYRRDYYELQKRKKFLSISYWWDVWVMTDDLMEMDEDSVIINMVRRINLLEKDYDRET